MAKMFERSSITSNDDGTYTITITPLRKKEKNKAGEPVVDYQEDKTFTAQTIEEAISKIRSFTNTNETSEEEADDMGEFMNPERRKSNEENEE